MPWATSGSERRIQVQRNLLKYLHVIMCNRAGASSVGDHKGTASSPSWGLFSTGKTQPSEQREQLLPVCPSRRWRLEILGSQWSPLGERKGRWAQDIELSLPAPGAHWPGITPSNPVDIHISWGFFFALKPSSNKNKIQDRPGTTSEAKLPPKTTTRNKQAHALPGNGCKAQTHGCTERLGNSRLLCLAPKSLRCIWKFNSWLVPFWYERLESNCCCCF